MILTNALQSMEQTIVGKFTEIKRHKPSVIYIPNIDAWYATMKDTLGLVTFLSMLRSIPPTDPVLLLASADCDRSELPQEIIQNFFGYSRKNRMEIPRPERVSFSEKPLLDQILTAFRTIGGNSSRVLLNTFARFPVTSPTRPTARSASWRNSPLPQHHHQCHRPRPKSNYCRSGTINCSTA